MQVLKTDVHFGITAVFAADLEIDTAVEITGNKTVNKTEGAAAFIGTVTAKRNAKNNGTIDVFARSHAKVKIKDAVAAGESFKFSTDDPVTGENRISPWDAEADAIELNAGVVWVGGAADATAEVFIR